MRRGFESLRAHSVGATSATSGERRAITGFDADDLRFMDLALAEAEQAAAAGEVPVGAVIVQEGRVIGRGRNRRETLADPTAHAEIEAIRRAAEHAGNWRLDNATIYVTLEPCAMCAGAIVLARIARVVFASWDPKAGACGSLFNIVADPRLNHRCRVLAGVRREQAQAQLQAFFRRLRA